MNGIRSTLKYKNDKMEQPGFCLGARLKLKDLTGCSIWTMSSVDYVKLSVENVEGKLRKKRG